MNFREFLLWFKWVFFLSVINEALNFITVDTGWFFKDTGTRILILWCAFLMMTLEYKDTK